MKIVKWNADEIEHMRKYYIVGNRVFDTRGEAVDYCNGSDFDPETMIQEEGE